MGTPNPPADPGATPATGDPPAADPTAAPPATGDGLGDTGKKLLGEMRAQIKELEKQNKALQERDPVKAIAEALGVKPQQGVVGVDALAEQVTQMQRDLASERAGRLRAEVAAERGLPPALAARLQGTTRDELEADADALKALIPATTGNGGAPGTPAPDPSQGARGGASQLQAALKAAQEKGDAKESIRLKTLIAEQKRTGTR
jgi:hypothetical protein